MSRKDLVVIGGSAGSMPVVLDVLTGLGRELHGCVCIALHLAPGSPEWLSTRFARATGLTVRSPGEDLPLQPGTIYIAKPDHHLIVKPGLVRSGHGARENYWRPAIDVLFRSAAVAYGSRTVGVLMSGELDDGTAGLQAIKACGGTVIVQDPAEADHPAMPRTALANVDIDHRVPAGEIAGLLRKLAGETAGTTPEIPQSLRREVLYAEAVSRAEGLEDVYGELDRALWAAIRLFEQHVNITRMLSEQERSKGRDRRAQIYDARARESQQHAQILRELQLRRQTDHPSQ